MALFLFIALLATVEGQIMPQLKHDGLNLLNNSFIYSRDIGDIFNRSLMCVSGGGISDHGVWNYPNGNEVIKKEDRTVGCLFSKSKTTADQGVTTLHRERNCTDHKRPGLWRCDALDSNQTMQSLYIYIGGRRHQPDGKYIYTVQSLTLTVGLV